MPIPGSRKLERLEENLGAAGIELTSGDLQDIETAIARMTIQGARYPDSMEKLTGR